MVVQTVIQMRLKPFRKVYINILVTRSDLQQLAHSNTASKEGEGRGGGGASQRISVTSPTPPTPPPHSQLSNSVQLSSDKPAQRLTLSVRWLVSLFVCLFVFPPNSKTKDTTLRLVRTNTWKIDIQRARHVRSFQIYIPKDNTHLYRQRLIKELFEVFFLRGLAENYSFSGVV